MNWEIGIIAVILLIIGLVGQGFEMKKVRETTRKDEELSSKNAFFSKRNVKWYIIIAIALILWTISERVL